ncbi:hypothetical protein BX667DRAFT_309979 [Coemansia mojavensis]|nr:hypothetical protein BX667DRAFT_309979 [Coemansia mojavensis]
MCLACLVRMPSRYPPQRCSRPQGALRHSLCRFTQLQWGRKHPHPRGHQAADKLPKDLTCGPNLHQTPASAHMTSQHPACKSRTCATKTGCASAATLTLCSIASSLWIWSARAACIWRIIVSVIGATCIRCTRSMKTGLHQVSNMCLYVGLPLENKPGYRFMLYIVDGTLLYDNGISGEKLLSKGTIHMFTTSRDISIYARNPSKTHRAHIIRMWIETDELLKNNSSCTTASDTVVPTRSHEHRKEKSPSAVAHPDFHGLIRHVADSDKLNCLLIMAQPDDYLPSFGMTDLIYGPMAKPAVRAKDSLADIRSSAASPLESSYYMSQSAILTRPEYFTPEPADLESNEEDEEKWEVTDPQLTSRVCVDPLKVEEDIFISICQLEVGDKVIYEPYDLHDRERALKRQSANPSRGGHRRVWIQTIMADLNNDASANGGRLVINGDMNNRMRPGDSAYVRRLELHETLFIENCGRVPIDFIVVETPY